MSAAFSKAAPADAVFTVSPQTAVLSSLLIGAATVNIANYTYVSGVLTIKQTYLSGLANGDKSFTAVMAANGNVSVTVTVGA